MLEMVVDNMGQTPQLMDQVEIIHHLIVIMHLQHLQILEEIHKKLTSNLHWKIAEVEDGYKGDNSLNTSTIRYGPENFPTENVALYPSAPTDV